ncbi:hypoxanthine phosphoribosyltransferase [Geomesophilobacter sediminis]|uniref:Hypoxanthine phosphoribosyltransferase n=1 Tax=Geomesophilobacter sediminis TaxID=2798584 RepID=A0A8J7IPQ1_9BACT|nr:hypoxanthine phosphoribosyltransferase [Geomesophilobacter sediminis]MBJ6724429.1 hypoxanthine phosphoribosyltransferase [Geomesophilobacter sediminis]
MERQLWLDRGFDLQLRYSKDRINAEIARLAAEISSDFQGQSLLIVVVLKGAFFFAADLVRELKVPVELDYVTLSSYAGTSTTGTVAIEKDLAADIAGRHVLVLEDIVDTGLTLTRLMDLLQQRGPESLNICTLIDKKERRQAEVEPKYVGIACEGGFLVGYGLDLDEQMRELSNIYEVRQTPGGVE